MLISELSFPFHSASILSLLPSKYDLSVAPGEIIIQSDEHLSLLIKNVPPSGTLSAFISSSNWYTFPFNKFFLEWNEFRPLSYICEIDIKS